MLLLAKSREESRPNDVLTCLYGVLFVNIACKKAKINNRIEMST
jgi:hypothetical protein